ncbi:hypothetical protein LTR70_010534 [Exophiala xenobiotica]|uniref:Ubiquitin-like domain-containing protein n=1 Tax=Lithohypha guttulata TaxID=1690604 RepID=A0ABR0JTP6_9EURO|nr:hypothetical protein LTR24_010511 [Lithohypha guttulata]KAK5309188.1 hypothetical protein LTR70_010534 [Exophiala xenobiotica]
MGPSIHINIEQPLHEQRPPSPSVSEEDEDGVQVSSPDEISPDYSVVHAAAASQSGSSQQGERFVELPYPGELHESEPDVYPYQVEVAPRTQRRSRQRSEASRESSSHRDSLRRVVQLQGAHHPRHRQRHTHPESVADDTDSTENFLQQPDQPEYAYRMPRDQQYHGQAGYTHSSSSGGYSYPPVPHHTQHMVPYAPPGPPQPMPPYQHPQMSAPAPYGYPPPHPQHAQPPPHPYPHVNTHHPQMASPYSQSPYGPPSVMQYQSPQSYFPQQYPPPYAHPYYMQQVQQYPGMPPPAIPPYMHYPPSSRESPQPAVATPAPAPAKPEIDEQAIMSKFEALFLAERAEREKNEEARQKAIQSAEDRAVAMAQAEKERQEEAKRIRADAIRAAEEEAALYRKMQQERVEEEKRIRIEALRAAEEEAIAQKKRDAERRAEEARIREEARREAIEAEKARIAAEAERAAYEQKIRKEAAEAALAAAAAELKAKREQADREAKIATDAAEAAKNAAEKQAKEMAEAAEKAAKEAAASAEAAAKAAKEEHEAKIKEAEAAAQAAKKEAEAAEAKAAANAPAEKKAPLRFKDALGRSYNFPWDRCYKWDDMEGLIHQAFSHIDKIGPHVLQGHYDLIGPDKEIIMPDYWEDSITPGMHITMMLWPIPEPEPEPEPEPVIPDMEPVPLPPPMDSDIIDIDALLNGVRKPRGTKDKAKAGKKEKPSGFAAWMLGGAAGGRGRPALKDDKKPDLVAVHQQHGAVEQGACTVM